MFDENYQTNHERLMHRKTASTNSVASSSNWQEIFSLLALIECLIAVLSAIDTLANGGHEGACRLVTMNTERERYGSYALKWLGSYGADSITPRFQADQPSTAFQALE